MPNLRSIDGGLTFVHSGTIIEAEEGGSTATIVTRNIVVGSTSVAGDAHVQIDPNNVDGPLVVRYDVNQGQKGITIEDKASGEDL